MGQASEATTGGAWRTISPRRIAQTIGQGIWRSLLLTLLTGVLPALGAVAWLFGAAYALVWFDHARQPHLGSVIGEVLLTGWWTVIAGLLPLRLAARPLAETARRLVLAWFGMHLTSSYVQPLVPKQMTTGYWWNGHGYWRSKWQASVHGQRLALLHDPQIHRDVAWIGVAFVAILPVASVPCLSLAVGLYELCIVGRLPVGIGLVAIGLAAAPFAWRILGPIGARFAGSAQRDSLSRRVAALESIQADLTQAQATELDRIERALHDGTQARIVALGLSLGSAERLVDMDPAAAKALLRQARSASIEALAELRDLVRGINPPILSERGLVDAVRALALDASLPVNVSISLPSRPERPIESAVYFAVAELLANAQKHAHARQVGVDLRYDAHAGILHAQVTDDGRGGAQASRGSGLEGLQRRLAAFDGHLAIISPDGGPTCVEATVPCVLS